MRRILVIVFEGVQPLDVTAVTSVFSGANAVKPDSYDIVLGSPRGGTVAASCSISFANTQALSDLAADFDTIIVAGGEEEGLRTVIFEHQLGQWLAARAATTRRIGSVCTGSFVLAASGLLDGHRCATHWFSASMLQTLCPSATVDGDAIFVVDERIFTSAGVTAAIDLSLALVEADLGRRVASAVARQLVVYLRRPGGQSQYSTTLRAQEAASDTIRDVVAYMNDHVGADLSIAALAKHAAMSPRNFTRRFREETGMPPSMYAVRLRVERARTLLVETDLAIRTVAERCGFGSIDSLERAFRSALGLAAREYRARFATSARLPSGATRRTRPLVF